MSFRATAYDIWLDPILNLACLLAKDLQWWDKKASSSILLFVFQRSGVPALWWRIAFYQVLIRDVSQHVERVIDPKLYTKTKMILYIYIHTLTKPLWNTSSNCYSYMHCFQNLSQQDIALWDASARSSVFSQSSKNKTGERLGTFQVSSIEFALSCFLVFFWLCHFILYCFKKRSKP